MSSENAEKSVHFDENRSNMCLVSRIYVCQDEFRPFSRVSSIEPHEKNKAFIVAKGVYAVNIIVSSTTVIKSHVYAVTDMVSRCVSFFFPFD